ncbi:MAG: hypothetical protein WCK51_07570 [Armatimonadota bacterium]
MELLEIYAIGDAIKFDSFPGQMIEFEESKGLDRAAFEPSVYDSWAFFMHNDFQSDEIAVIVHGPATGYVMQRKHDGMDKMLAPSVAEFFEGLVSNTPSRDVFDYEDVGWIYPRALTDEDRSVVDALLAAVTEAEDPYEGESLAALAMSIMLDDEFVARLGGTLFPIPNFRAIIWGRLQKIDSDAARAGVAMYKADYEARSRG